MENNNILELQEKYSITKEEKTEMYKNVIKALFSTKLPVANPKIIYTAAQPGAGKSYLISSADIVFGNSNFVYIDQDLIRTFHPHSKEISEKHPELYYKLLIDITKECVEHVEEKVISGNYNAVYETSLKEKDFEKLKEKIEKFKSNGFELGIATLSVHELETLLCMQERYEAEIGLVSDPKYITFESHDESYNSLGKTLQKVENLDISVIIYNRQFERLYETEEGNENLEEVLVATRKSQENIAMRMFPARYERLIAKMKEREADDKEYQQMLKIEGVYKRHLEKTNEEER